MTEVQRGSSPVTVVLSDAPGRARPASSGDGWLEQHLVRRPASSVRAWLRDSLVLPALWARRTQSFSSTTIGMMMLITVGLTIAILAAGMSMSQSTDRRQAALTELSATTEPMSAETQDLFTSLSLADTIAATGFVQAGIEPPATRQRYERAIQRASAAATHTASGLGSEPSRELDLITKIQTQLPVYTGLVETARTNNRAGNPVGVAYMSEASSLMRLTILPAARELLDISNARLNDEQRSLAKPQWVPISGLVAAVIMLVLAQRWLALKTRRRLNKGFLAATALMLVALIWVITTNAFTWYSGSKGYEEASAPLGALTDARVLAQQARTEETMALVRRETSSQSPQDFDKVMGKVRGELELYESSSLVKHGENQAEADKIATALDEWEALHGKLRRSLDQGEYNDAIALSFQGKDNAATTDAQFNTVDTGLAKLMTHARQSLKTYLDSGLRATRWVSTLVLILSFGAVASIWLGIRPRLQEYL